MRLISTVEEIAALSAKLSETNACATRALAQVAGQPNALHRLMFEPLGCDPLDESIPHNLAEQIEQQANFEAGVEALEFLFAAHPGKRWMFAPGSRGQDHDIISDDGEVAAEVFAAVSPAKNQKLKRQVERVAMFNGSARYVFFRSPAVVKETTVVGDVTVVSLGA